LPAGVAQLPNYHLYQPYDAYKGTLQPHQKATYDFFIPQRYREECQKKMFATQQTLPSKSCCLAVLFPFPADIGPDVEAR